MLETHVETDVFESRDLGGARRVASQLVAKITIDPEPCTLMLEKLQKSNRSFGDCCRCLQHMSKDQPWLLWVSERRRRLLETHKCIARTCRPLIAFISLLIQRLHKLY